MRPALKSVPMFLALALLAACNKEAPAPAPAAPAAKPAPAPVALLSRQTLFGNPERSSGAISPDGKWLGYVAPLDGVLNVYVAPADKPDDAKPLTHDQKRGVRQFWFAYDGKHLLYRQDEGGDENFQVHTVDLATAEDKTITPKGVRAEIQAFSTKLPNEVLLAMNDRNKQFFDVVRVTLDGGKTTRVEKNDGYESYVNDDDFKLRYASKPTKEGGYDWFTRAAGSSPRRCASATSSVLPSCAAPHPFELPGRVQN